MPYDLIQTETVLIMSKHRDKTDKSKHPFQIFARDCRDRGWNGCCLYVCKARTVLNLVGMTTIAANPSCDGRKCKKWKESKEKKRANRK